MIAENGRLIVSHSGLRGRPDDGLDGEVVDELVRGLLSLLSERDLPLTVGVARDARRSGEGLGARAIDAATKGGAEVVDLGVVSTPTAKLAAKRRGLGGTIVVTGSHLGPEWNGLKAVAGPDYWPLDPRALPDGASGSAAAAGGVTRGRDAAAVHAAAACASVDAEAVRRAGLRVSIAGGCGDAVPIALERLGCRLVSTGADVGLVLDGDGDRLQLIDEHGRALDPEATFPLVALALGAKRLVKGADTSRIVDLMAEEQDWAVRATSPGERHLLQSLEDWGAGVAGEGNGGVVVPAVGMARDGLAAAASILALVASRETPLSRIAAELPHLSRRRASVPCPDPAGAADALGTLADNLGATISDASEGITIERPGEGWALIRQSATEPVLRITVECADTTLADQLYAEVRAALPSTE